VDGKFERGQDQDLVLAFALRPLSSVLYRLIRELAILPEARLPVRLDVGEESE
jgi:hypothetical protein